MPRNFVKDIWGRVEWFFFNRWAARQTDTTRQLIEFMTMDAPTKEQKRHRVGVLNRLSRNVTREALFLSLFDSPADRLQKQKDKEEFAMNEREMLKWFETPEGKEWQQSPNER